MMAHNGNGTHTRRGYIPHLRMRTGEGQDFEAPVKILVQVSDGGSETRKVRPGEPMIWKGKYVHALPGGGEILGGQVPAQYLPPVIEDETDGFDASDLGEPA